MIKKPTLDDADKTPARICLRLFEGACLLLLILATVIALAHWLNPVAVQTLMIRVY